MFHHVPLIGFAKTISPFIETNERGRENMTHFSSFVDALMNLGEKRTTRSVFF